MSRFIAQYLEGIAALEGDVYVSTAQQFSFAKWVLVDAWRSLYHDALRNLVCRIFLTWRGLHNYVHVKSWFVVVASASTLSLLKSIVYSCTMIYNTDLIELAWEIIKCQHMNEVDSNHMRAIITYFGDNKSPSPHDYLHVTKSIAELIMYLQTWTQKL